MKAIDFLFKRYYAETKLRMVNEMTNDELYLVSKQDIIRILKEVGVNRYKSRDKELRGRLGGNDWNSTVDGISQYKGKLYVSIYLQYENTDTSDCEDFGKFFARGDYRGSVERDDRYGNPRHYYYTYTFEDKMNVIRQILLAYVNRKYADKLKK